MAGNPAPKGVFAAVSTPVTRDLKPDVPRFLDHCHWLLSVGCAGLAPLGTTGEANSLGTSDRLHLIEAVAKSDVPLDRMIVGTGSTSAADTVLLSRAALQAGVNGLLMLPPYFYKSPSDDGLFNHFATVAERLADDRPRIFLYHFPQMSAVPVSLDLVRRLRTEFPGMFVGLKDSGGDFADTATFIREFPGFEVFAGSETFAVQTLDAGGWGCISATANVSAPIVVRRIADAPEESHERLDRLIADVRAAISALGNVSATKAVMSVYRNDREWARTLPPNVEIEPVAAEDLAARIDGMANIRKFFAGS